MLAGRLILLVDHLIRLVDLLELLLDVEASRLLGGGAALHLVKLDALWLLVLWAFGALMRLISEGSRSYGLVVRGWVGVASLVEVVLDGLIDMACLRVHELH